VILCGGESTRFGSDKTLVEVEGEPLVLRVARRVSGAAHPVALASGRRGRLASALGPLPFAEIDDAEAVEGGASGRSGPLGGLVAGLEWSPSDLLAAVAADLPFASAALLRLLASLIGGHDAAIPVTADGTQPLHAIYSRRALPALRGSLTDGRLAVRDAVDGLRVRLVEQDEWKSADPRGSFAVNVNRPSDLGPASMYGHVSNTPNGSRYL
jgi:molybdopterin-guanine dinucleotide biosynthesis protein A